MVVAVLRFILHSFIEFHLILIIPLLTTSGILFAALVTFDYCE